MPLSRPASALPCSVPCCCKSSINSGVQVCFPMILHNRSDALARRSSPETPATHPRPYVRDVHKSFVSSVFCRVSSAKASCYTRLYGALWVPLATVSRALHRAPFRNNLHFIVWPISIAGDLKFAPAIFLYVYYEQTQASFRCFESVSPCDGVLSCFR
jgi:hypothetical protein